MNATILPRVLAIMGSGETAPTMAKVHRALLARLGRAASAVLLDTPYGFQENADEITARTLEYFRENVGASMTLAPFRAADDDALTRATAIARARAAQYLFAGPGSPSYALRQWAGTELPAIVADKLARGGIVTFASAAALTLGAHTVPVYEIYKVGEPPRWLPGLDVLGPFGLSVAVIPHYDNAEGGTHDTRFCYLGERRLAGLESELPAGAFILGVDSHTALVLDLDSGTAAVAGLGGVTIRASGRSAVYSTGAELAIADLGMIATRLREGGDGGGAAVSPGTAPDSLPPSSAPSTPRVSGSRRGAVGVTQQPVLDAAHELELRFGSALDQGSMDEAVRAVLELEALLVAWSRDTTGTDEIDRARAILAALVVRLGERSAVGGEADEHVAPLVELLMALRADARSGGDFAQADRIRGAIAAAGIELRDTPDGTTWHREGR